MKNVSLIEDKKNGGIFGAVVSSPKGIRAYGASGQGLAWASWVNAEKMSIQEIESALDTTLVFQKSKPGNKINLDDLVGVFDKETLDSFRSEIETKQLVQIIETKNEPLDSRNEDLAFEMEHMYAEEENISNWPITDVALASIDVAYKQIAVQYKAKAFNLDRSTSSMLLQVKGARAVWDPSMPGGGGYRCPDNTPNGGQFTNRIGAGCTFGVMRRIGRGLQAASLGDITQPVTGDESEAQARILYNLGRSLEQRGAKRQQKLQEKFKRRVERRVKKLSEKDKKRNGAPSYSQIYQALNPDMARRDRARIAAGNVLQRMGNDMANAGHVRASSRRLARKAKTPTPRPWDGLLDPNITPEQRRFGGRLDTDFGGFYNESDTSLYDFDTMMASRDVLEQAFGSIVVDEARKNDPNFPFFLTMDEVATFSGDIRTAFTIARSIQSIRTMAKASGHTVRNLTRAEVDDLRANKKNGEFIEKLLGLSQR